MSSLDDKKQLIIKQLTETGPCIIYYGNPNGGVYFLHNEGKVTNPGEDLYAIYNVMMDTDSKERRERYYNHFFSFLKEQISIQEKWFDLIQYLDEKINNKNADEIIASIDDWQNVIQKL